MYNSRRYNNAEAPSFINHLSDGRRRGNRQGNQYTKYITKRNRGENMNI